MRAYRSVCAKKVLKATWHVIGPIFSNAPIHRPHPIGLHSKSHKQGQGESGTLFSCVFFKPFSGMVMVTVCFCLALVQLQGPSNPSRTCLHRPRVHSGSMPLCYLVELSNWRRERAAGGWSGAGEPWQTANIGLGGGSPRRGFERW